MGDEHMKALARWVRAVIKTGVGIVNGPRLLLLKDPFAASMQCSLSGNGRMLDFRADWPEVDWLAGADRAFVAPNEIGFEMQAGSVVFVLPLRKADAFCGAQHCAVRGHAGDIHAMLEIQTVAGSIDAGGHLLGLPRLVLKHPFRG